MLSLFDNLVVTQSAHDVTAAYCLAMADERVRFPLGAVILSAGFALISGRGKVWDSAGHRGA